MQYLRLIAAIALLALITSASAAKRTNPLPEYYAHWLNQDVLYLITDEERKAFLALGTDTERDRFIEDFWDIRNPAHGGKTNPFKEEHYRRLEYANSHFGRISNTPGWMTDEGRAYILFGKPTSQHHFIGYGQIYPIDLWFYSNDSDNPALPPFFTLLFYIPEDIGEYRLYRPYGDGPLKLVRGSRFNTNRDVYRALMPLGGDVAHAAFSLIPGDPVDTTDFRPDMSSDMLVSRIKNLANDPFNVRRLRDLRSLRATVNSVVLVGQEKPLNITSIALADPAGREWLDYSVLVDDAGMGQVDSATNNLAVNISYRLLSDQGELIVEDSESRAYPAFSGPEGRFQAIQVANRLPIVAGKYRLEVQIANRAVGRLYKGQQSVVVPEGGKVSLSGPLIADAVVRTARPDAAAAFQYFGAQFRPAAGRSLSPREPMRLLFGLTVPPGSTVTYEIEYLLANLHEREARQDVQDSVQPAEFAKGRLMKSKTIPLTGLLPGEYRLVLNVREKDRQSVLASVNLPFKVKDDASPASLYLAQDARKTAEAPLAAYIRGLESSSQHRFAEAAPYLEQAFEGNPANTFAAQFLVQLYFNEHKFQPVADLYRRYGLRPFQASPETLAQISVSTWEAGDRNSAKEILRRAQGLFPKNQALEVAAANLDKAVQHQP